MTILDQAMMHIKGVARIAACDEMPAVRIVFDNPRDQTRFKLELVKHLKPSDAVTAPIASNSGLDSFEVAGMKVELSNRERGARATAEKLIQAAEKALSEGNRARITNTEIVNLRHSLAALLNLVRG